MLRIGDSERNLEKFHCYREMAIYKIHISLPNNNRFFDKEALNKTFLPGTSCGVP